MSKILSLIAALAAVASVNARCDNQCSGHGTCMTDDVCQCYDNFGSGLSHDTGDCSDRICPYEIAWVDNPNILGQHHKYMECAGKGVCDRSTGECQCFDGFDGKACARAACPNDCSGHGVCTYIEDLPYAATWNDWVNPDNAFGTQAKFSDDAKTFAYTLWDKTKSMKCVCDATYGDLDCSKRLCPYGTDVLDTKDSTYFGVTDQKYQEQVIILNPLGDGALSTLHGKTFALTFKSRLNETFTTIPIYFDETSTENMANDIKLALLKLPNGVVDGVTVTVVNNPDSALLNNLETDVFTQYKSRNTIFGVAGTNNIKYTGLNRAVIFDKNADLKNHDPSRRLSATTMMAIKIRFTGPSVQGPQHLLIVEDYLCQDGCTPKLTGLALESRFSDNTWSTVVEVTASDYNSFECGRRGKCDYTTGLCSCFAGYIGDNCNTLTTLV